MKIHNSNLKTLLSTVFLILVQYTRKLKVRDSVLQYLCGKKLPSLHSHLMRRVRTEVNFTIPRKTEFIKDNSIP